MQTPLEAATMARTIVSNAVSGTEKCMIHNDTYWKARLEAFKDILYQMDLLVKQVEQDV